MKCTSSSVAILLHVALDSHIFLFLGSGIFSDTVSSYCTSFYARVSGIEKDTNRSSHNSHTAVQKYTNS